MVCKVCHEGRGNGEWPEKHTDIGPHFRMDRHITSSLKLHLLPYGLWLLLPKILKLQSKNMKENVSENYCPTDKPPSDSFSYTFSWAHKAHSLWSEFCHTISFSMESVLPLYPNQALLLEKAVLYSLGKNSEGWCFLVFHQHHFHLYSKGERDFPLKKCCFLLVMTGQGT